MSTRPSDHDSTSAVPFSPVPGHSNRMKFDPTDDWTYDSTPLRVLWEQNYRDAAHRVLAGDTEGAYRHAAQGRAMESAYLERSHAEWAAGAL